MHTCFLPLWMYRGFLTFFVGIFQSRVLICWFSLNNTTCLAVPRWSAFPVVAMQNSFFWTGKICICIKFIAHGLLSGPPVAGRGRNTKSITESFLGGTAIMLLFSIHNYDTGFLSCEIFCSRVWNCFRCPGLCRTCFATFHYRSGIITAKLATASFKRAILLHRKWGDLRIWLWRFSIGPQVCFVLFSLSKGTNQ